MAKLQAHSLQTQLIETAESIRTAGFNGPKTELLLALLEKASAQPQVAAKAATQTPVRKHTREPRPVPPGTWDANRGRVLVLGGQDFDAPTIAKGVCAVFTAQAQGFKATDAQISEAVQGAFPENVYHEYRVVVDRKKWALNKFGFQAKGLFPAV